MTLARPALNAFGIGIAADRPGMGKSFSFVRLFDRLTPLQRSMQRITRTLVASLTLMCVGLNAYATDGLPEKIDTDSIQQARVHHILFSSSKDAERTYKVLRELPPDLVFARFKASAKQESKDPGSASTGGDLGMVKEGEMVKEFELAVFQQELLTVSKPFKSAFGWHIIYVSDKSKKPISIICKEGLTEAEAKSVGTAKAALRFSLQARSLQDLHPGVLQFIGESWSSPLKDWHGNLAYFRKSVSRVKSSAVVVEQHTEYVHAVYNAAPQTCRHSAISTYEVNCSARTVSSRSRQEFEGRGLSGRKLLDWKWSPAEAKVYNANEGFMGQLTSYACAPTL